MCVTNPPRPLLPVQSPTQLNLVQKANERAIVASASAHAPLLERWNEPSTLEAIHKVCPSLRTANVGRILDRFYEEIRVVEVSHKGACHFPYPVNCRNWPNYTILGTLSNITATMDHIILVNDALWSSLPGYPDTDTANVVRNFQRICYHEHPPVDQPAFDMVTP